MEPDAVQPDPGEFKPNSPAPSLATESRAHAEPQEEAATVAAKQSSVDTQSTAFILDPEDEELLIKYFSADFKDDLVNFQKRILAKPKAKPATLGSLLSSPVTDRVLRGRIHQDVRRIFDSKIETASIDDGVIKFSAAPPIKPHPEGYSRNREPRPNQPKGNLGWQELGGEYLHFSLYKENKNTLEITSFLSRRLKIKPKDFGIAGTKDRRAATVQRVSVKRQHAERLAMLNRDLRNAKMGDFKYEKHGLELGDLQGNEFVITLRDCHFGSDSHLDDEARLQLANDVVGRAVEHLKDHGFINYFGLQRFGSFDIGTDEVGKKILMGDFEGAVWDILAIKEEALMAEPNPNARGSERIASDYIYRARAIDHFKTTGKNQGLPLVFSAEQAIIRHLSSHQKRNDYLGALMAITRNMRSLYPHAYQSLVWNTVASERWSRYGDKVIEGDLVIIDTGAKCANAQDEVDESGEVVIHPADDDVGLSYEDLYQRARPLSAEEAKSNKYTIFDIVLPTPGFDVEYPNNDIGDFYKEFMGSRRGGGLDPANMRRPQKDFSLSGSYRKLLAQVGKDLTFNLQNYYEENEQLVETDLDKLNKSRPNYQRCDPYHAYNGSRNGRGRDERYDNRGRLSNSRVYIQHNGARQHNKDIPEAPPATESTSAEPTPSVHPNLTAWQNLPAKLAAEDEAASAEYETARLAGRIIHLEDTKQPIYRETFIETALVNNEGQRTGHRSTKYIGTDGKEVTKEEAEAITKSNAAKSDSFHENASEVAPAGNNSVVAPFASSMDSVADNWAEPENCGPAKIGLIVKFTLGPSMYATMALRELMKAGGVKTYRPGFTTGA